MGLELVGKESPMLDMEESGFTDSETLSFIIGTLEGVSKAPSMIGQSDRDQYEYLIGIVDPTKELGSDEALLATVLKMLTQAVYKIDPVYHVSLLSNIFNMSFWNCEVDARNALMELIASLAAVPDKFLDGCLLMIVSNFQPPRGLHDYSSKRKWLSRKKDVHSQLYTVLHWIVELVPFAFVRLKDIIDRRMPRYTDPKEAIVLFVECMLGLERNELTDYIGSTVLVKMVDLLIDLDVNISWESILQDDVSKDIFVMEFEDAEGKTIDKSVELKNSDEQGILKGNVLADKLDALMVIMCEHLKTCATDGRLVKVFEMLMELFRRTVLNVYRSKFSQFVIFYACSLDPENCGTQFAVLLANIYLSKAEDPISRMSAVAYLASYLSRAKFISTSFTTDLLERLVFWSFDYCKSHYSQERNIKPKAHRIFYSGCQAIMYILCFRMRLMFDTPELKLRLMRMPLEPVICHALRPLEVCLPYIVQEFLRQANAAQLFKTPVSVLVDSFLESDLSKTFGGAERLDMFFPFDPYLLKESDRFMRPNFEFWSMVQKTYSEYNSEDELDDEELDTSSVRVVHGSPDSSDIDSDDEGENFSDEDTLEYSMNKMSLTPRPSSGAVRMPARIRPSASP